VIKVAIIGQQCSGKTTLSNMLRKHVPHSRVIKFADPIYHAQNGLGQPKCRAFMQDFGDLAKRHFGEMVFVNAFEKSFRADALASHGNEWINMYDMVLCDDVRRTYELTKVKELGFSVVYVDTPENIRKARAEHLGLEWIPNHNSETEVPSMRDDANLVVNGHGWASMEEYEAFIVNMILPMLRVGFKEAA